MHRYYRRVKHWCLWLVFALLAATGVFRALTGLALADAVLAGLGVTILAFLWFWADSLQHRRRLRTSLAILLIVLPPAGMIVSLLTRARVATIIALLAFAGLATATHLGFFACTHRLHTGVWP